MTPEQYARVKQLFLEALSADDRAEFLDRAVSDPEVRREVEDLLKYDRPETILSPQPRRSSETVHRAAPTLFQPRELAVATSELFSAIRQNPVTRTWLLAIVVFLVLASVMSARLWTEIKNSIRHLEGERLRAFNESDVRALNYWLGGQQQKVESWVRQDVVVDNVRELLELATRSGEDVPSLKDAPQQAAIQQALLEAGTDSFGKPTPGLVFAIWDGRYILIAASPTEQDALGERPTGLGASLLTRVFAGKTIVVTAHWPPQISAGFAKTPQPVMAIIAPIWDDQPAEPKVLAAALVRGIGLEDAFKLILSTRQTGASGESYAFDQQGVMISPSRFDDDLRPLGILPADPETTSVLHVQLRDPGGDLTRGYRPSLPLAQRPLTKMAASATQGDSGIDLSGYRDYRGRLVVGAWTWLSEYDFGVATEIDYDEVFAPLFYLLRAYLAFVAMSVASLVAIAVATHIWLRRRGDLEPAETIGPYRLEAKIGEGGMGRVYRARHQMLVRPTAVKVLKPNIADPTTIKRFQREVQFASQLTHPNTIAIYDYGRTEEGVFYYAMEYLDGLNFAELIRLEGRVPPERVVFLLQQVCASLREAHEMGLVHRDIKPQNLMICARGGLYDFVKVLDFGLVKESADPDTTVLAGTPRYMAPERLLSPQTADPRSDVYSLGAVCYNLLTGADLFPGEQSEALLLRMVNTVPERVSESVRTQIPEELDQLVADCLAKDPQSRPQSMVEVLQRLEKCQRQCPRVWTQDDARRWWLNEAGRITSALAERASEAILV